MRRMRLLAAAILLTAAGGCGGGTATLSGKVSYKGQPVLSGSVIVLSADGTAREGVIEPDGTYEVPGVSRGHVRFGVLSPDPARARSILNKEENQAQHAADKHPKVVHSHTKPGTGGWFPLPPHLGDPEKSGLEFEVAGSRVRHDIEMN
jgi:hypothetical protein